VRAVVRLTRKKDNKVPLPYTNPRPRTQLAEQNTNLGLQQPKMDLQAQPLRFINISNPARPAKEERRLVRSHASREAYARIRRARVANYLGLSENAITTSGTAPNRTTVEPAAPSPAIAESSNANINCPPLLALPAGRVDPFGAFAVPLRPMESFLLDHCKLELKLTSPGIG